MSPPSPSYTFHNESLKIHDFNNLPAIVQELKTNPSLASKTISLEILDLNEEDVEYEEPLRPSPYTMEVRKREAQESIERGIELSKSLAEIVDLINVAGVGLEFFKWSNSYGVNYIRSNAFWDALWATVGNLKGLELGFYKDELAVDRHGLKVNAPSIKFTALANLVIDASNAHGHDGSLVDSILLFCPVVEILILHLTNCDLEDCRIKNITWSYTFPSLTELTLYAYNSNNDALSSFIDRHPNVTSLKWGIDSESPFIFQPHHLPQLEKLHVHWASDLITTYRKVLLASSPIWKIRDLKVSYLENTYELILALSSTLEILELDIGVLSWRQGTYAFRAEEKAEIEMDREEERKAGEKEEDMTPEYVEEKGEPLQVLLKGILGKLARLRGLSIDLESGNTYTKDKVTGNYENPGAMGRDEMKSIMAALANNTSIRTLKMSDSRGHPLPGEMSDQEVSKNVEIVEWDITKEKGAGVYRVQRSGPKVKFIKQN